MQRIGITRALRVAGSGDITDTWRVLSSTVILRDTATAPTYIIPGSTSGSRSLSSVNYRQGAVDDLPTGRINNRIEQAFHLSE